MSGRQWVRDVIEAGLVSDGSGRGRRSWLRGGQVGRVITVVICEVVQSSCMRHRTCLVMMRTTGGSLVRKADRVGVGSRSDRCHTQGSTSVKHVPSLLAKTFASSPMRRWSCLLFDGYIAVSGTANLPVSISRAIDKSSIRRFLE